jgi:hypothetical protein
MAEKRLVLRDESQPASSYAEATPCEWVQQRLPFHWLERALNRSPQALLVGGPSARKAGISRRLLDEHEWGKSNRHPWQ